ncbi:phage/plasmid replication protein, II/X family [Burkholderia cepacia]|uniref:phage/plasmid replication protein, II/X family n=1 Tax=Burkholderia cepacia TaxID=292 RepID=UPI00162A1422|nr:phage/plasmid replication protein, II/X family [Burkholderia cepacia]
MDVNDVTTVLVSTPEGTQQQITNRKPVPGKSGRHALHYRVKSRSPYDHQLFVEGSPFANRYGQNVWSSASVKRACTSTVRRLIHELNINATSDKIDAWINGDIELYRVDLAVNFRLESSRQVDDALTQLKRRFIAMRCQCSIHVRYAALCPRGSRHYSIAAYDKGDQMSLKSSGDHADNLFKRLAKECEGLLRIEVRLRRAELKKLGLTLARDWGPGTARDVFRKYFARLPLRDVTFGPLSTTDFEGIDERMRPVLALHKLGADWKQIYSDRTRVRHKAYFKARGIDLDCPSQPDRTVSLLEVLARNGAAAKTPSWLIRAGLAPRRRRRLAATLSDPEAPKT